MCFACVTITQSGKTREQNEQQIQFCVCAHARVLVRVCVCVRLSRELGTGLRDAPAVLPAFVSQSFITSALCAIQRSHVTIFEQLQTIVGCLLSSIDTEGRDLAR